MSLCRAGAYDLSAEWEVLWNQLSEIWNRVTMRVKCLKAEDAIGLKAIFFWSETKKAFLQPVFFLWSEIKKAFLSLVVFFSSSFYLLFLSKHISFIFYALILCFRTAARWIISDSRTLRTKL